MMIPPYPINGVFDPLSRRFLLSIVYIWDQEETEWALDFLIHHLLLNQIRFPSFSLHQKLSVFKFAQSANLPNTERIHDEGYKTNILDEKLEHVRLKLLVKSEGVANSSHLGKTYHRLICTSLKNHPYSLSHWCLAANLRIGIFNGEMVFNRLQQCTMLNNT